MTDKLAASGVAGVLSQKSESIMANDNQNFHGQLEKNARTSMIDISTVNYCQSQSSNLKLIKEKDGTKLPAVNLPEKILIVVDTGRENNCTPFELGCGAKHMPLQMIKKIIEVFICAKSTINRKHEYALMILNEESTNFICNYTNDYKKLSNALNGLTEFLLPDKQAHYDLSPCFEGILESVLDIDVSCPSHINRVILIYTRSNSIPKLSTKTHFELLMKQNYFFFDALYVHEPLSDNDKCEQVYAALSELDIKQNSWIFEVGRNAAQLHTSMAKLLAHPLQRVQQYSADYKIFTNDTTEIQTNV